MKSIRLIGQIQERSDTVGYVVLDVESNKAVPRTVNEILIMTNNGYSIVNATFVQGELKGTESSLSRLPVFSPQGMLSSSPKITILGVVVSNGTATDFYYVMDSYGNKKVLSTANVLKLMQVQEAVNAKLVTRDGKQFISAIKGTFAEVSATDLGVGSKVATPSGASESQERKVESIESKYKGKQFLHKLVARNIDRLWFPGSAYNKIAKGELDFDNVESVNDIKGKLAVLYGSLANLSTYLLSSTGYSVTVGDAFREFKQECIDKYETRMRYINSTKKDYNGTLTRYRELISTADEIEDIVARKEAGEYISSTEFKSYYYYYSNKDVSTSVRRCYVVGIEEEKRKLASRLSKLKSEIERLESAKIPTYESITGVDFPFFDRFIKAGKLDYTMHTLRGTAYLRNIKTKGELMQDLDALFLIAVISDGTVLTKNELENYTKSPYLREDHIKKNKLALQARRRLSPQVRDKYENILKELG